MILRVNVGRMLQQQLNDIVMVEACSKMQWCPVVLIPLVHIGPCVYVIFKRLRTDEYDRYIESNTLNKDKHNCPPKNAGTSIE